MSEPLAASPARPGVRGLACLLGALGGALLPLAWVPSACPSCRGQVPADGWSWCHLPLTVLPFLLFAAAAVLIHLGGPSGRAPAGAGASPPAPGSPGTPAREPA